MTYQQQVYPTGRGALVEGWRAECSCRWRTSAVATKEQAQTAIDAHVKDAHASQVLLDTIRANWPPPSPYVAMWTQDERDWWQAPEQQQMTPQDRSAALEDRRIRQLALALIDAGFRLHSAPQ